MKEEPLFQLRCYASYILAYYIWQHWPKTQFGLSQITASGFWLDLDTKTGSISEKDFERLEAGVRQAVLTPNSIEVESRPLNTALAWLKEHHQLYLLEHFSEHNPQAEVLFYKQADFRLPLLADFKPSHLAPDFSIHLKITNIGGAYWRNQADQTQLQRLQVVVFGQASDLTNYLDQKQDRLLSDHRQLNKEQNYFMISELVGAGLPLWLENGAVIRRQLENFVFEEEFKQGYTHVYTPDIAGSELYKISGHLELYKDSMYPAFELNGKPMMLRPMTCPHHFQIYKHKPRSFRDLPIRLAEAAKLYRQEQSGELMGLTRVLAFTLTDAHIICRPDQAEQEIVSVFEFIESLAQVLGLVKNQDYFYRLSLGDRNNTKKYHQDPQAWDEAEALFRNFLQSRSEKFVEVPDDAAFYGPKVDIQMYTPSGKDETAFTVQYDFVMPKRFNLTYVDEHNQAQETVVIHRSAIGSIERVTAFLIETYKGKFPIWLAPCQLKILTVNTQPDLLTYAQKLKTKCLENQLRVRLDDNNQTIGRKIRTAQLEFIPYVVVLGQREMEQEKFQLNIRRDLHKSTLSAEQTYTIEDLMHGILADVKEKN